MTPATIDLIHDLLNSSVASVPDRLALVSSSERITFAQFDDQVRATAAWVSARTQRGDRVAVIADNGVA